MANSAVNVCAVCDKTHAQRLSSHGAARSPPAALAYAALDLAALAYRARRGERMVLDEEAPLLGRFALPRLGWWRRAPRERRPTPPRRQRQLRPEESLTRQAWVRYRAWSRLTSGVWRRVMGAVPSGTAKVFSTSVPHVEAQA